MTGKGRILNYIKWLINTIDGIERMEKEDKERRGVTNKKQLQT